MPAKLDIDEDVVRELASIACTMIEIAAVVNCSVDTLERRFADVIKRGRETAKTSLRRFQWKAAEGGSVPMMIWLGKQLLGQRDIVYNESENYNVNVVRTDDQLKEIAKAALAERAKK